MPLPLIFLIRHGETDWNREGRYQGQTDIPLNDRGRGQARRNGETLRAVLTHRAFRPEDLDYVGSPLARAAETMEIVRRELGLPEAEFHREPGLMEAHYGAWEGLTIPEIHTADPRGLDKRAANPLDHAPPGGESYRQVGDRAMAVLARLERPTVVVAHGGVSKAVRGRILGLTPAEMMSLPTPQDLIHVIENGQVGTV